MLKKEEGRKEEEEMTCAAAGDHGFKVLSVRFFPFFLCPFLVCFFSRWVDALVL